MNLRFLLGWGGVTGLVQAATFRVDHNGGEGRVGTDTSIPFDTAGDCATTRITI